MFKIIFFWFFCVWIIKLSCCMTTGSGVAMLIFRCWLNACFGAYTSFPSIRAVNVFACWSNPSMTDCVFGNSSWSPLYCHCLRLREPLKSLLICCSLHLSGPLGSSSVFQSFTEDLGEGVCDCLISMDFLFLFIFNFLIYFREFWNFEPWKQLSTQY